MLGNLLKQCLCVRRGLCSQFWCPKKTIPRGDLASVSFYSQVRSGCGHYKHGLEASLDLGTSLAEDFICKGGVAPTLLLQRRGREYENSWCPGRWGM